MASDSRTAKLGARVRARWPGVDFSGTLLAGAVQALHPDELCLTLAAVAKDPRAFEALDRDFLLKAADLAARLNPSSEFTDEIAQSLRERLFLCGVKRAPRIGDYDGSTPLPTWLNVVARHCAIDLLRARSQPPPGLDDHLQRLVRSSTPELQAMSEQVGAEFRVAVGEAIESLGNRNRAVLRLFIKDGASLDALARSYGVHRATVARWIATSRATLRQRTCQNLARLLGASEDEVDSLLRAERSNLDVSISAVFRSLPPGR